MARGQPDRVPVWCQLSLDHIIRHAAGGKVPRTIEEFVSAECAMTRRYGFDGVVLYLPAQRAGSVVGEWLQGLAQLSPGAAAGHVFKEADPDSWPRPEAAHEAEKFCASRLARQILGPDYHVGGWTPDGFSRAVQWFPSIADALTATAEDPERFRALVQYYDEECAPYARAQVDLGGVDSIHVSSPYSGSPFISRGTYARLVSGSVRAVAAALAHTPAFSYLHTCGCISDRLDLLAATGVDGIECMDPPPLGDTLLSVAKDRVGHRVFLKGNIDSVNVLLEGSDEQVDEAVLECLRVGMPGGGYILSTACSVAPGVRPDRVLRLSELVEEHGWYDR